MFHEFQQEHGTLKQEFLTLGIQITIYDTCTYGTYVDQ